MSCRLASGRALDWREQLLRRPGPPGGGGAAQSFIEVEQCRQSWELPLAGTAVAGEGARRPSCWWPSASDASRARWCGGGGCCDARDPRPPPCQSRAGWAAPVRRTCRLPGQRLHARARRGSSEEPRGLPQTRSFWG